MTSFVEVIRDVVTALNRAGVEYMITGSIASTFYSDPRATQDLDVVVWAPESELEAFAQAFDGERYCVGDYLRAFQSRDQFNIVYSTTVWKIDVFIRKDRPFSESEFARKTKVELLGMDVYIATVEDMILAKLEWSKLGQSERQLRDVASMIQVNRETLDTEYLHSWAASLNLLAELNAAMSDS